MSEDVEPAGGGYVANALLAATLGTVSDNPRVDTLLDRQIALADLQIDAAQKQDAFELSHLRWRRFNDQMKGALQIMIVALGALVVVAIGAAMWNASQADGLVVDSFSVPPALAATGTTGDIVADDMTNKIAAVRDFANENSLAHSKDVRQDRGQDIKVEIPETGVSLAQAWLYLRQWLGHEQHLRGNIRTVGENRIALTASLGGADTFMFTGAPADLDKLEQQAAERVFGAVDPINIVLYLIGKDRKADAVVAVEHLVSLGGDKLMLSQSYSLYANVTRTLTGDVRRSVSLSQLAVDLDPRPAPQHMELLNGSRTLGHDEVALQQARAIAALRREDNIGAWRTSSGVDYVWQLGAFWRAAQTGDFAGAMAQPCTYACTPAEGALRRARLAGRLHDVRLAKTVIAQAEAAGGTGSADLAELRYRIHETLDDWPSAMADADQLVTALLSQRAYNERYNTTVVQTRAMPLLAYAQARNGAFAKAWATIDATPRDCYNCIRARGQIAALQNNWGGAQYWFERAVGQAPSVPFAYADWGQMLMAKGDLAGATAKFESAHKKGPRFADPLEMWGEAMMLQNRSDLALAKFTEAARYAPSWGRLHLKWGEALWWSGDKIGAMRQFILAKPLALAPSDRAELNRVSATHA